MVQAPELRLDSPFRGFRGLSLQSLSRSRSLFFFLSGDAIGLDFRKRSPTVAVEANEMWGRRSIVRAGVAFDLRPVTVRPAPLRLLHLVSRVSRLPTRSHPRLPLPRTTALTGFTPIRHCSSEIRMMASQERETLPDV